ncbi:MAG TPA: type II toxin-antitoxin system death-on-curing family toxin [Patescibacteria group bacterium]|nr:type II toxin-antitoxin system death-on-curing family toxin [Patescibacteria group bacterium]
MLIYLPTEDLIKDLHDAILEISGGRPGIRDETVIHAAVNRPKTHLAYNDDCDLHTVCAVILESISRNHGFVEGNKRTGLMSALLTYELNGVRLDRKADKDREFEELALSVVVDKPEVPEIASRLKTLTEKYQMRGISKFVANLKNLLVPYDSDNN